MTADAGRLLTAIAERRIAARLLGGAAIRIVAGDRFHVAFERPIADLDLIVARRDARALEDLMEQLGYAGERQFNALNGHRRLLFEHSAHGRVDVFVETFEMCHTLPLAERLDARSDTLAAAELLLTKLQIVELNAKDRGDALALLHALEVADHDDGAINAARIAELTARDWGLQHTVELNLGRLRAGLDELPLADEDRRRIAERADAIGAAIEAAPKSRGWKLRARVGERRRWYEEPEEVDR
jgi:hypothetical protein